MDHHGGSAGHHQMAHLDLMPVDAHGTATTATHVAVNNGSWFDPATWNSGEVPGEGALVHIPAGVTIYYEGASDASLFILRVDGALKMFAENGTATKMVVDTIITSGGSYLKIDAADATDGTVDIVFAEGTPAAHSGYYSDVSGGNGVIGRYNWDPEQLSLGLVASGKVVIEGQQVDSGLQLAEGPLAGATELVFNSDLADSGWTVGQKIVVGGTKYLGDDAGGKLMTEDEVRTITNVQMVDGQMLVTLDRPLDHDHRGAISPQSGLELAGFVGNLSRNVTFSSAVADGDDDGMADRGVSLGEPLGAGDHYVTERGHIMFMHNDNVSLENSAFFGLGRTDKSVPLDDFQTGGPHNMRLHSDGGVQGEYDPATDFELETPPELMMNTRGRYAIHLHEANGHGDHDHHHGIMGPCPDSGDPICKCVDQDGDGILNREDPDYVDGAYLQGNVVWGTPGWGIVQHSSAAALENNVVYDAAGSAFVAELGDETGRWTDNLAIGTYGVRERDPTEDAEDFNEDDGAEGVGFYTKSRAIEYEDNAAVSSGRAGFFLHTTGAKVAEVKVPQTGPLADIANGREYLDAAEVPILVFDGNHVIGAREGIRITADPLNSVRKFNDTWSIFQNFTAQEVDESGVSVTYSSKYVFKNFLILGTETKLSDLAQQANSGFFFKASVADMTVVDSHVENFTTAYTNWSQVGDRQEYRRGFWDPKDPANNQWVANYEGMGAIEGIENPVWNLWNNNVVNLTYDNIEHGWLKMSNVTVDMGDGTTDRMRGVTTLDEAGEAVRIPGVSIELLGDSRDGGLVALWREDIATHPDQERMLREHIPLAYNDKVFLSQIWYEGGYHVKRNTHRDYDPNINDDIWSGTVLEFAKEDSLGRQVFLYGDFAPLDPSSIERSVTTNERIVFSREMVDATLIKDGYRTLPGVPDAKFVVMKMGFSDRLTGETEVKSFLVLLDLAWTLPVGTQHAGVVDLAEDLVIAPQYRLFWEGRLLEEHPPIILTAASPDETASAQIGLSATDEAEQIMLSTGADQVHAAGGDDLVRGFEAPDKIDGGAGHDALFGGHGSDRLTGGIGNDLLDGHLQDDFLYGGTGDDQLQGGLGRDHLEGGADNDVIMGGHGQDHAWGGAGDDTIDGGNQQDHLWGGEGNDQIDGGQGSDTAWGGAGDDVIAGMAGNDVLYGGDGNDALNGGTRADQLFGGEGNDILQGGAGTDALYGGNGKDVIEGEGGADRLFGGHSHDLLFGGSADDWLSGGTGRDWLTGGEGNDRMSGGRDADRFLFDENSGEDVITDFEDGVDAIEFMIQAFGFDDLEITQSGSDAYVTHAGGHLRLIDTNAADLTEEDFLFSGQGG